MTYFRIIYIEHFSSAEDVIRINQKTGERVWNTHTDSDRTITESTYNRRFAQRPTTQTWRPISGVS